MAATFQPQDALNFAKNMIANMPMESLWGSIAQDASSAIWTAAPWRWSIGTITPVTLTAGSQSFALTPPNDFLRLDRCYIANASSMRELKAVGSTQPSASEQQLPDSVSFISNSIQFDNVFGPVPAGVNWKFYSWYKKQSPNILNSLSTPGALVMDDDYFWVYREFVLYYAFKYAYDQKAGSATITISDNNQRQVQYSGQLAIARASLEEMRRTENILFAYPDVNPNPVKDR